MLRARPEQFRETDFTEGGRPDLTWYYRYRQYETVVYDDGPGLVKLLVPNGVQNAAGQTIIPEANIRPKNELRDASNWYLEAMTATPPVIKHSPYTEARQADLQSLIRDMIATATSVGHGLLTVVNDPMGPMLELIPGTNIAPIQEAGNPVPEGWIMYWPYYHRPINDRANYGITIPNRIKVKTWRANGEQCMDVFAYYSGIIGRSMMADDGIEMDPPLAVVAPYGVDEGFYPEAIKSAGEIARLDATIRELATTYAIPVTVVNAEVGVKNAQGQLVDLMGRRLVSHDAQTLQSTEPGGSPVEFVQAATLISELMLEREAWRKHLHYSTRIPIDITENQDTEMSGVSRALLARPAISWIESTQQSATEALDICLSAITGRELGSLEITWARQPFDTEAERRVIALGFWDAGVFTRNEAREWIGAEQVPGGDVFKDGTERRNRQGTGTNGRDEPGRDGNGSGSGTGSGNG